MTDIQEIIVKNIKQTQECNIEINGEVFFVKSTFCENYDENNYWEWYVLMLTSEGGNLRRIGQDFSYSSEIKYDNIKNVFEAAIVFIKNYLEKQ